MKIEQLKDEFWEELDRHHYYDCFNADSAAEACVSIVVKHMKKFIDEMSVDWKPVTYNKGKYAGWYWKGNEEHAKTLGVKTTEDLIQFYFDSLNKKE